MARLQSSVGLVTGIPIADTVEQLLSISAQPRNRLQRYAAGLQQQQIAIGELTALTIAIQMSSNKLGSSAVFQKRTATSSDEGLLTATATSEAALGRYYFTPVRTAQNHQLISEGIGSLDEALGGGELSLGFGGFVNRGIDLEMLNGGAGIERGKIRITDRSGNNDVIDLRFAVTIDDVLQAINGSDEINVTAVAQGDAIRLIDETGLSLTNLKVQEVSGGRTAADLGLAGIDASASDVTGQDLVRLDPRLRLSQFNDGTGVSIRDELPDLEITFRDGSSPLQVDLQSGDVQTLGDLLDALNAADPTRLQAAISLDGQRLELTDLTAGGAGTFSVSSAVGGSLAEDLGIALSSAGNSIAGGRLLSGLKGPLLSSLSGGEGISGLGDLSLTDRNGMSATVSLAGAETLADVIDLINGAGIGIVATVNEARNGIALTDTTGSTTNNLIVANGDATNTADQLRIAFNGDATSVNSGSLDLQVFHENLRLDELNHGKGIKLGSFTITDSLGNKSGVNLAISEAETVGDVIGLINGLNVGVEARVNATGDGILLVDIAGGNGKMLVEDSGSGTSAAGLKLAGEATVVDLNGTPTQVIDGRMTSQITLEADDTLQDVVDKINALDVGVSASVFQSGSGVTPYRIALSSQVSGTDGEILLDTSQLGIAFREIARAQDAILQVGSSNLPGAGVLATSSSNRFSDVLEGVQLTMNGVSDSPVVIDVKTTGKDLVANVKSLVDQYNKLRDKIDELTFFDETSGTTGILFGSNEALQIESRLSRLVTGRFFGVGSIQSLEEVGVSINEEGKLELDESKLTSRFDDDPEAVQEFFTNKDLGFAAKLNAAVESLSGEGNSMLITRNEILQRKIDMSNDKIEFYNERLEAERERLLKYYYNMEIAISKIKSNLSAVQSLAAIPLISGNSSN